MEYQKFIPEGWNEQLEPIHVNNVENLLQEGKVMQGYVTKCDPSYNLYVELTPPLIGVIPREEVEAINIDETGFPKPNICINKVNTLLQFKIKDKIGDTVILSRKEVGKEAIQWLKEELKVGQIVHGIVKNIRPYGVFVEIGGRNCWIIAY
ncbi:MAG: S1 RNA-binding domain-containing protein [Clostridia bacterium]